MSVCVPVTFCSVLLAFVFHAFFDNTLMWIRTRSYIRTVVSVVTLCVCCTFLRETRVLNIYYF